MDNNTTSWENENDWLSMINEDMTVYDRDGDRIGKVETVYFGSVSSTEDEMGKGPMTTGAGYDRSDNTLVDAVADAIDPDEVPDVVRSRLLRSGYIRIDAGLLSRDLYALPEHVASVHDEGVRLNIKKDGLIRADMD
jgi:hypothetical protein